MHCASFLIVRVALCVVDDVFTAFTFHLFSSSVCLDVHSSSIVLMICSAVSALVLAFDARDGGAENVPCEAWQHRGYA